MQRNYVQAYTWTFEEIDDEHIHRYTKKVPTLRVYYYNISTPNIFFKHYSTTGE